jgi:hypothetical protein
MGADIEAAAVAAALGALAGRAPGVRLPMPRSSSRGAAVAVSVAAAGLAALGGKAGEGSP